MTVSVTVCVVLLCCGGLVAQAVRRSPPTAGVRSSRLDPSMRVSWWTKRGLGRFFTGFLPFSPTTNIYIVLCGMMMKGREKVKPGAGSEPALIEKHQGGRQA